MIKGVASIKESILGSISLDLSQLSEFLKEFDRSIVIIFLVLVIIAFIAFLVAVFVFVFIVCEVLYTIRSLVKMICLSFNHTSDRKTKRLEEMKKHTGLADTIQNEKEEEKYLEEMDNLLGPSPSKLLSITKFIPHPFRFLANLITRKENMPQKKDEQ